MSNLRNAREHITAAIREHKAGNTDAYEAHLLDAVALCRHAKLGNTANLIVEYIRPDVPTTEIYYDLRQIASLLQAWAIQTRAEVPSQ